MGTPSDTPIRRPLKISVELQPDEYRGLQRSCTLLAADLEVVARLPASAVVRALLAELHDSAELHDLIVNRLRAAR